MQSNNASKTPPPSFPQDGARLDSMVCVRDDLFDFTVAVGESRWRLRFNVVNRSLQFARIHHTTGGDVLDEFSPHRGILLTFVEALAADMIHEDVAWMSNRTRPYPDDRVNPDIVVSGYDTPGACKTCVE